MVNTVVEIERKWVLGITDRSPFMSLIRDSASIKQGYVITEGVELRIRRTNAAFYMTVKGQGGLSRNEWEVPIPEWVWLQLLSKIQGRLITKMRYYLIEGGHEIAVDVYSEDLSGLVVAECEFPSEDKARAYSLPLFLKGVEVTSDKRYKNKALALHGLPSEARNPAVCLTQGDAPPCPTCSSIMQTGERTPPVWLCLNCGKTSPMDKPSEPEAPAA